MSTFQRTLANALTFRASCDFSRFGGEHHGDKPLLAFVRNFHGPTPKIERTVQKEGNKRLQAISKTHRRRMCSSKIVNIVTNVVLKILIRSGQMKVEAPHDLHHRSSTDIE